ncbi:MAG: alpha/beta hydrolase, partial [Actinobacteria bacterium]|nr:alpha/beta hydrolase [Actinomycetota bacterium]
VLFVHGSDVDHTFCRPWVDPLCDVARLLFVDLVGHGRSDPGAIDDWNLNAWADSLADLCGTLRVRPVVAGFSLGGRVAMRLAVRHPETVAALALVNASGVARPDRTSAMFRKHGGDAAALAYERDLANPTTESMNEWFRLCQPLTVKRPYTADEFADMVPPVPGVTEQLVKQRNRPENLLPELSVIGCPTLVMTGDSDPLSTPDDATDLVTAIGPNATLCVIENSGHGVFRDNPEAFLETTQAFIRGIG